MIVAPHPSAADVHRLHVSKASLILGWYAVIALAAVTGIGSLENALLLSTAAAMGAMLLLRPGLPARVVPVLWAFVGLFVVYAALTVAAPTPRGMTNTVAVAVSAMFFLFFAKNGAAMVRFPGTAWVSLGTAAVVAAAGLATGAVAKNAVSGLCTYPILTAGLIWIARGRPPVRTAVLIFAALGVMAALLGHRAMAGGAPIAVATFLALWFAPLRFTRLAIIVTLVASMVLLVALYAHLWGFDIRDVDFLIKEASGRTATSGRQFIWPTIFEKTSHSPWIGLGTGTLFEQLYRDTDLSAHNFFLQIYMQSGLLGLGSLVVLFAAVWRAIGRPLRREPVSIYLSACYVIVLIHCTLEVFLMQGNPTIGCGAWMLLGLGVGIVRGGVRPPLGPGQAAAVPRPIPWAPGFPEPRR